MQSQLTVRLSDNIEQELSSCAKKLRLKRSDVVRMALEKFFETSFIREEQTPYERVSNLIGSVKSRKPDLGQAHRQHLIKKIKKHV